MEKSNIIAFRIKIWYIIIVTGWFVMIFIETVNKG